MDMITENKVVPKLRFKEFKDSWFIDKFSKYIKLYRGSSPRPISKYRTKNNGVNWIKIGDTKKSTNYEISSVEEQITFEGSLKSRKVEVGELILANSMSFGKTYKLNISGCIYDGWFVLREYQDDFYINFLHQLLNSNYMQKQYIRFSTGGVVQNISSEIVYSTKICKPNLYEQQKIASFLSAIDEKLQQLTKKKELLEDYKKGIMQKIFSQEIRFKDDSGSEYPDWQEKKLGQVCSVVKGKQLNKSELTKSGLYPALNGGINPSGYTSKWNTEKNVITISEGGNSCGYVNLSKTKFWCGGHCYALLEINDNTNFKYLFQILKFLENKIMRLRVGSTLPNIQMKEINRFLVFIPNLEEQVMIANVLSSIDKKIEFVSHQLEKNKEFKKGLLQQMFV